MSRRSMPATWFTDGLLWTREGVVWAIWRVRSLPYGLRPDRDKQGVRGVHTALLRAFQGEALYASTVTPHDPAQVVERMIAGVDLTQNPRWALEAEARLDELEGLPLGERIGWIAVPMRNTGWSRVQEPLRSATYDLADWLALRRPPVEEAAVAARRAQADQLMKQIPRPFEPRPASRLEIAWWFGHAMNRSALDSAAPLGPPDDLELRLHAGAVVGNPVLDEGGRSDLGSRLAQMSMDPLTRRFLKITDPSTNASSYQVQLVVLDTPPNGLAFPGGEWLGRIDESGLEVDWAIRADLVRREKVQSENARALRELNDQYDQQGAGGLMSGLDKNASTLGEYAQIFADDELEMEVSFTNILTVSGPTADAAIDAGRQLREHLGPSVWKMKTSIELGAQEDLWWATLPGVATPSVVRQLAQVTTTSNLAAATFFTSTRVGDPTGFPIAEQVDAQRVSMVMLDMLAASRNLDTAIAVAACGELGAGKSYFLMSMARALLDRGAQIIAIDRTPVGEWGRALAAETETQIVDISSEATMSMDPLRVLPPQDAAEVTQSFLQVLMNFSSSSEEADVFSTVLEHDYRDEHSLHSLLAVQQHLLSQPEASLEHRLGKRLRTQSRTSFARALFDESLPAIDMKAPALVFGTAKLKLPSTDELNTAHRHSQMSLEKVFGRAMNLLVFALARRICFADPLQLAVLVTDETASLTGSPETCEECGLWLRDGRKHLAGLLFGSHDAEADFGALVEVHLIAVRLLMRHRDETLARRGLAWIGLDPEDQDLVDVVTRDLSPIPDEATAPDPQRRGEGILRDFRNRYGRVKVIGPARSETERVLHGIHKGAIV